MANLFKIVKKTVVKKKEEIKGRKFTSMTCMKWKKGNLILNEMKMVSELYFLTIRNAEH